MKRLGLSVLAIAALAGILAATGVLGSAIDALPEGDCPYGSTSRSNETLSCKPRPRPSDAEQASVLDGSALRNALAAFRRSTDGKRRVVGVGINRWGETTIAMPTGEQAFGKSRERFVTFDRSGEKPPQSKPESRNYELVRVGGDPFGVGAVQPAALRRAMSRIRKGAPNATFQAASFARSPIGMSRVWMLRYSKGSGAATSGSMFQMSPDGSGLCALGDISRTRGIQLCGFSQAAPGQAPGIDIAPKGAAPPPAAKSPGGPSIDCVTKAGTDVAKLQACLDR